MISSARTGNAGRGAGCSWARASACTQLRRGVQIMPRYVRISLCCLVAIVALGAGVSSASATRLALSSNTIRVVWTDFEKTATGIGTMRCPVTLEGTLHSRTIVKVVESLIGYVTRATIDKSRCSGGFSRFLTETLPWHIRYASFEGALPSISAFNTTVIGVSLLDLVNFFGTDISCLYRSSTVEPVNLRWRRDAGGLLTTVLVSGRIRSLSGGLCPEEVLSGKSATPTVLGSSTGITMTLVA